MKKEVILRVLIDTDLDEFGMREKIKKEIERYHKFQSKVLGFNNKEKEQKEIDIRNYAKYILKDGSIMEKRELLTCFKSRLFIKNKILYLEK